MADGVTSIYYYYEDSEWGDLLISTDHGVITYDNIGNPLTYYNGSTFTWSDGRKLTGVTRGTNNISYTYDANGYRASKTVNGITTEYYWLDGKLYQESTPSYTLTYIYDESGMLVGFTYKTGVTQANYYYVYNLQGDVVGIIDSTGSKVVEYTYDAWGDPWRTTGPLAATIGKNNPIRYRGYYFDAETGFYYLQSRYYDPYIGRFINVDSVISGTGESVQGYNLFVYCFNNPINMSDILGNWPKWLTNAANRVANALGITTSTGSVTTTGSSATAKGPTVSRNTSLCVVSSKASATLGYAMARLGDSRLKRVIVLTSQ